MQKTNKKAAKSGNRRSSAQKSKPAKKGTENKYPEIPLPSLEELLKAGAHFGHRTSRWDPKMEKFIYTERNDVHIIDLVQTLKKLHGALREIQKAADRGRILIVGTKGQASTVVKEVARRVGAYYIDARWPGGLFTNFDVMKKSLKKLRDLEEEIASQPEELVKKEILMLKRRVKRLNKLYAGVKLMDRLPKLLIVIDSAVEKNAIREANKMGVPVVALVDTNCNPVKVDHPIPANDDSIKSIKLFVNLFGKAVKGGKQANALISMRTDYEKRIERIERERDKEIARKKAMEKAEQERILALKEGKQVGTDIGGGKVVGVVKKVKVKKNVAKKEDKASDSSSDEITDSKEDNKVQVKSVKAKKSKKPKKTKKKEADKSESKPKTKSKDEKKSESDLINLNEAELKELKTLDGFGDALAKRIVDNRPFEKIADVKDVKGVGKKAFEGMQGKVEV